MKGLLEQFSRMEIFLLFLRNPSLTRLSTSCHQIPWERRAFTSLKNMKLFHLKISHLDSIKKSYSKRDAQINGCHTILMRKCTACLPQDFAKHFGTKAKPKNCHAKFHCLMLYGRKSLNHCLPLTRMYTKNVANHSPVAVTEIMKFLTNKGLKFEKGHTCIQTICPKHKLDGGNIAEPKKLFINMTSGFFVCNSCRKSGLWSQLQDMVNVLTTQGKWKGVECFKELPEASQKEMLSHVGEVFKNALSVKSMAKEELAEWRELCDCKELLGPTFIKYGVMFDKPTNSLLMPFHANHQTVCGFRRLTRKGSVEEANTVVEVTLPKLGPLGLFGMNIVDRSTTEIVLTISEWDAMAVYQTTNFSALALPRGILMLPQEVLPLLEPFSKIILWFGNDLQSWEAAKQFAKKLNERRCYLIRPNSDDLRPLEALKQNQNLKRILNTARLVMHQSITTFPQMREEVYSEVAQLEQVSGIKWKRFPMLNKILKGHRRGELTVFTGPTGTGKTTFMSDYSLDLCMRGVNTLWGSFELRNVRLAKILLTQFAQINLSQNLEEFDHWADKFEHLPLYFMTFFGQENIKRVIETMSHAVYVHDIAHVVVDNVQFMMGSEFDGFDRFIQQDQIIAAFRKFATTKNCHVSLVMHPRKEKDGELLTIASVFGGAKATQEADNVIILQDKFLANLRTRKYIQILKNRFDGELGIMPLRFDKDTQSFSLKAVEKLKQNP